MPGAATPRKNARTARCFTLGLALDASGLVRRSRVLAGNVREHQTLETLLTRLRRFISLSG